MEWDCIKDISLFLFFCESEDWGCTVGVLYGGDAKLWVTGSYFGVGGSERG